MILFNFFNSAICQCISLHGLLAIDAINALKEAISILTERGRFHAAATHQKTIAEIYESDVVDLENALLSYEQAAEWFAGEEAGA